MRAPGGGHTGGSIASTLAPPPPRPDDHVNQAAEKRLRDLFHKAADFKWKPDSADDYKTLANLALAMNDAKDPQVPSELGAAADDLFGKVKDVTWTEDHIEAINQYNMDHLETPGEGVVFVGKVNKKQVQNGTVVYLFLIGNTPAVVITSDPTAANLGIESRMLVFGRITVQKAKVSINGQISDSQVIVAHYMTELH